MSLFRRILVFSLIFASQARKSEDDPKPDVKTDPMPTEPDAAKFNSSRKHGSVLLKISVEKAECVNEKTTTQLKPYEGSKRLGAKENPAKSCDDYIEDTGISYIKSIISDQPIKVYCDLEKKSTCVITKERIKASDINSAAITLNDQIWLSQTTFDVESLFNKIGGDTSTDRAQISVFLSTSTKVHQKIRYYYSTVLSNGTYITTKEENKVGSLKALLWNDHLVVPETKQLPMKFTVSETEPCFKGDSDWMCNDIIFETNSNNRLPVTDFYIENLRATPGVLNGTGTAGSTGSEDSAPTQKLYFELHQLCFHYN